MSKKIKNHITKAHIPPNPADPHIGNPPQINKTVSLEQLLPKRHQRRPLHAKRTIPHPKIANRSDSSQGGQDCRLPQLPGQARLVKDGVAVA
jgi:hypothetical protein